MNEADMNYKVEDIGLSTAIYSALYRGGIRTVADLLESMENGTINGEIRSIGPKSRKQICKVMENWLKDDFHYVYRESDGRIGRQLDIEPSVPCGYCSHVTELGDVLCDDLFRIDSGEVSPWLHLDIIAYIKKGKLRVLLEDDTSNEYFDMDVDISYCPMCGKKLKKEEPNE